MSRYLNFTEMDINTAIELLKAYKGPFELTLFPGASDRLIAEAEKARKLPLPDDFKTFYRFTNGFEMDEDIFNMLSLNAIITDCKYNFRENIIAEYMIYSDMWRLEVNPANCNDYDITVIDYSGEKFTVTKSLGEFIARFLKGRVFETGGLYALQDEIKSRLRGRTEPQKIKPFFGALRDCLILGLFTLEQAKAKADWTIATEDGPHDFFIDMSLCRNLNELITLIDSLSVKRSRLQSRALLGVTYTTLLAGSINAEGALRVLEYLRFDEALTQHELDEINYLLAVWDELEYAPDSVLQQQITEKLKDFLSLYFALNLYNYDIWLPANTAIDKELESKC